MTNVEIFLFCEIDAGYHLMNGKMKERVLRLINSVLAVNNSGTRLKLADVSKRQRQCVATESAASDQSSGSNVTLGLSVVRSGGGR